VANFGAAQGSRQKTLQGPSRTWIHADEVPAVLEGSKQEVVGVDKTRARDVDQATVEDVFA
jgi:hypothetical protein